MASDEHLARFYKAQAKRSALARLTQALDAASAAAGDDVPSSSDGADICDAAARLEHLRASLLKVWYLCLLRGLACGLAWAGLALPHAAGCCMSPKSHRVASMVCARVSPRPAIDAV